MRSSTWTGLIILLVAFAPSAWSQPSAVCHFAEVPGPIVLPDNSLKQAGGLQVCLTQMYSPSAGLHRVSVDGRVAGMYVSRQVSEAEVQDDDRPYFVFARLADGSYELQAYGWSDGAKQITFAMRPVSVRSHWQLLSQTKFDSNDGAEPRNANIYVMASAASSH